MSTTVASRVNVWLPPLARRDEVTPPVLGHVVAVVPIPVARAAVAIKEVVVRQHSPGHFAAAHRAAEEVCRLHAELDGLSRTILVLRRRDFDDELGAAVLGHEECLAIGVDEFLTPAALRNRDARVERVVAERGLFVEDEVGVERAELAEG